MARITILGFGRRGLGMAGESRSISLARFKRADGRGMNLSSDMSYLLRQD